MSTTIKTNNHWRNFLYSNEVPKEIRESEFDYMDDHSFECAAFLKYRGHYYKLNDFDRINKNTQEELSKWDGIHADTFPSATVIKISDDCESYQIGYCYSLPSKPIESR